METNKSQIKKGLIGLIVLVLLIGGYFYFISDEQAIVASFKDNGQKLSDDIINCEFKVISNFIYKNRKEPWSDKNRKIYYETSNNKIPNLITFAGLSTKEPKIKSNNGDSPVTIIKNDAESVVLIEQNDFGDMFTYTIFKQEKVAVWHKAYNFLPAPYALLSMGYCY